MSSGMVADPVEMARNRKGQEELDRVYRLYQRNISFHGGASELPACPVCRREISGSQASRGHVYPAGCELSGGFVLECRRCNNTLGGICDERLAVQLRMARHRSHRLPTHELAKVLNRPQSHVTIDAKPAVVRAEAVGERVRIDVFDVKGITAAELVKGGRSQLIVPRPDAEKVKVGLLHCALLHMFHHLGYEYALQQNVRALQDDLTAVADRSLAEGDYAQRFLKYRNCIYLMDEAAGSRTALHLVEFPDEMRSFLCLVPVTGGECFGVLMPGFGPEGARCYERAMASPLPPGAAWRTVEASQPAEQRLLDANRSHFGRFAWTKAGTLLRLRAAVGALWRSHCALGNTR